MKGANSPCGARHGSCAHPCDLWPETAARASRRPAGGPLQCGLWYIRTSLSPSPRSRSRPIAWRTGTRILRRVLTGCAASVHPCLSFARVVSQVTQRQEASIAHAQGAGDRRGEGEDGRGRHVHARRATRRRSRAPGLDGRRDGASSAAARLAPPSARQAAHTGENEISAVLLRNLKGRPPCSDALGKAGHAFGQGSTRSARSPSGVPDGTDPHRLRPSPSQAARKATAISVAGP